MIKVLSTFKVSTDTPNQNLSQRYRCLSRRVSNHILLIFFFFKNMSSLCCFLSWVWFKTNGAKGDKFNISCWEEVVPKKCLTLGLYLEYETFIRGVFCPNLCCLCVCVCLSAFFWKKNYCWRPGRVSSNYLLFISKSNWKTSWAPKTKYGCIISCVM